MDKTRRNLLAFAIFILGLAVYTLVSVALELFMGSGFDNVTIPEGAPENVVEIAKTFLMVVSLVMVLPQLYVGIKGIRVARNPDSSKGHIFWAAVLLICTIVGFVYTFLDWSGAESGESITLLIDYAIDAIFYFEFITYARKVRNEY